MTLAIAVQLGQIFTVALVLPVSLWRAWRSIDRRLDALDKRTMRIEAQFFKNGGSSMKDDMIALREVQANIKGHLGI